jgi:hypothetical protein
MFRSGASLNLLRISIQSNVLSKKGYKSHKFFPFAQLWSPRTFASAGNIHTLHIAFPQHGVLGSFLMCSHIS